MRERVYVETTFVSYLTGWPSRDVVIAGHQQITHEWWNAQRTNYELCISELVLVEAASGDPQAAKDRLDVLNAMNLLETTVDALSLAKLLVKPGALPPKAAADALHIAIAAAHGIPYLMTWNCRHLANATRHRIRLRG